MKTKLFLLLMLTLGTYSINVIAQTRKSTTGSGKVGTYNDCLVFDLKGRVKSCRWIGGSRARHDLKPLTRELTFDQSGFITNTDIKIIRDDKKRIYTMEKGVEEILFKYNNDGKIKYIVYGPKSDDLSAMPLLTAVSFSYDNKGSVTKATDYQSGVIFGEPLITIIFKYIEFDDKGNWTKREYEGEELDVFTLSMEKVTFVERRVIEYYP